MARAGLVADGLMTRILLASAKPRTPDEAADEYGPMTTCTPAAAKDSMAAKAPSGVVAVSSTTSWKRMSEPPAASILKLPRFGGQYRTRLQGVDWIFGLSQATSFQTR